jgi:hypothetical protein
MNFTHFITHHGKRINKEHYVHLVQVAKIDGTVKGSELELLHKEGKKFGLTDPEIDHLINSEEPHSYSPPYSLADKFEQLYNIAVMILADDVVTESEKRMIKRYAIAAGFDDQTIEKLIVLLFRGIADNESEESLLKKFRKDILK